MRSISRQNHPWEQNGTLTAKRQSAFCRMRGLAGPTCVAVMLTICCAAGLGQEGPTRDPDRPYIIPEANPLPDANDRMKMSEKKAKQQNFDAANEARTKQILDDTAKLLILTRDLKAQTGKLGNEPLSPRLVREAEVIELLAHDVQTKMKLTVGGS